MCVCESVCVAALRISEIRMLGGLELGGGVRLWRARCGAPWSSITLPSSDTVTASARFLAYPYCW